MKKKVPYLETSQEKSQPKDGNGSSSMGYPTPTGNRIAAILQPPKDSSSPTENQSNTQWDDTLEKLAAEEYDKYTKAANLTRKSWAELPVDMKLFHMRVIKSRLGNGELGVNDYELLQFWNQRIPVRQK